MAINTVDDLISKTVTASEQVGFMKLLAAPKSVGAFCSSWKASGRPVVGFTPPLYQIAGSGYTCDETTLGALQFTNASLSKFLTRLSFSCNVPTTLILMDRLWSCSGMGFAAGTYTVTTPGSLPARVTDGGVGVEAWVENFVAAGAATGSLTLNYLNTSGQSKSGLIPTVVSAPLAQQLQPIPLAVGDLGVSQVTSVVTSATWTSGSFGITLMRRLAEVSLDPLGKNQIHDWAALGLPKIPADACLMLAIRGASVSSPTIIGHIQLIDG